MRDRVDLLLLAAVCAGIGCGRLGYSERELDGGNAAIDASASTDAFPPATPFSAPVVVSELANANDARTHPSLSADQLELVLSIRPGANTSEIWRSQRVSIGEQWSTLEFVSELNLPNLNDSPELSPDGLRMYFSRASGPTGYDVHFATRPDTNSPWDGGTVIGPLVTDVTEHSPTVTASGLLMIFDRAGTLFESRRASTTDQWGVATELEGINDADSYQGDAFLADGGLTLYYSSDEIIPSDLDIYVRTRPSLDANFGPPTALDSLNSPQRESDPWVSPDGRTIYFSRGTQNVADIWTATR